MRMTEMEIVLSNDDKSDRLLFVEALTELQLEPIIHITRNGFELMEFLLDPDQNLPDAVFLDINMPGKTGIECLEEIRTEKQFDSLPVIIYSTSSSAKDIDQSYDLGANFYIPIPVGFESMKNVLFQAMHLLRVGEVKSLKREEFVAVY